MVKSRIVSCVLIMVVLALQVSSVDVPLAAEPYPYVGEREENSTAENLMGVTPSNAIKHEKIASILISCREAVDAAAFAGENSLYLSEERTRVELEFTETVTPEHIQTLTNAGVKVETTYRNLVQGLIPISKIMEISSLPFINYIQPPNPGVTCTTSEGVSTIGADLLHAQGHLGGGMKVAIIDPSFDPTNPEIASNVVEARSFRADGLINTGDVHGTACAEIVVDIAPQSQLYLLTVDYDIAFCNAIDYAMSIPVNIISCSFGWASGPFDGTDICDQKVDEARTKGIYSVVLLEILRKDIGKVGLRIQTAMDGTSSPHRL